MRGDSREQLLRRITGEFLEMPGLQLTRDQAQRLWGMDRDTCDEILRTLAENKFLVRGPDARYRRLTDGTVSRAASSRVMRERVQRVINLIQIGDGDRAAAEYRIVIRMARALLPVESVSAVE